jgi:hypothetical protein
MPEESNKKTNLKKRIAEAAGINPKTVERGAKNLILMLFGVDEKELERDPALRAYVNYKLYGDDPRPLVVLDEDEAEEQQNS